MRRLLRFLICAVTLALCATSVVQAEPEQGLIRSQTALPRTFPLILRLPQGKSGHLTVTDPVSRAEVLTAYARAGMVLRVLVPPGEWSIRVATGGVWQDEGQLFGPETRIETFARCASTSRACGPAKAISSRLPPDRPRFFAEKSHRSFAEGS